MTICQHCGCEAEPPKAGKRRSVPQHRRYFAMIRAAYHHWPLDHAELLPHSEDQLRHWLQCKAGYHLQITVDTAGMTATEAITAAAGAYTAAARAGEHPFSKPRDGKLYVFWSKSIDFNTLPHLDACALFDAVADVIEAETGLKVEQIMPPVQMRAKRKDKLQEAGL